jgi:hypothetical protein
VVCSTISKTFSIYIEVEISHTSKTFIFNDTSSAVIHTFHGLTFAVNEIKSSIALEALVYSRAVSTVGYSFRATFADLFTFLSFSCICI